MAEEIKWGPGSGTRKQATMGGIWLQVMVSANGVLGNDSSSHGRRRPDTAAPGLGQVNDARLFLSSSPAVVCSAQLCHL